MPPNVPERRQNDSLSIAGGLSHLVDHARSFGGNVQNYDQNQRFVPAELHFKAETPVILQVTNEDNVPVEFESSDLNKEKMVLPGKSIELLFRGLKPGVYEFFSDFGPGVT